MSGCEVCGQARASEGWLVASPVYGGQARLTLCSACQHVLGVANRARRPISWARVAMLTAAGLLWGSALFLGYSDLVHLGAPVAMLEFWLGATGATAVFCAGRHEEEGDVPAPTRRPAIDPALEQTLSNSKLLAHLRAVSDFPEEDFLQLRPNSALARKLQRGRAQLACTDPDKNSVLKDVCPWTLWA